MFNFNSIYFKLEKNRSVQMIRFLRILSKLFNFGFIEVLTDTKEKKEELMT